VRPLLQHEGGLVHETRGQPEEQRGDEQEADEPLDRVHDAVGCGGRSHLAHTHSLGAGDCTPSVIEAGCPEDITAHGPGHGHDDVPGGGDLAAILRYTF
jgi:hypothetical protein